MIKALRTNTAYLQSEVARRVNTKYAAKLKFLPDESFDEGGRIDTLLRDPKVARDLERLWSFGAAALDQSPLPSRERARERGSGPASARCRSGRYSSV